MRPFALTALGVIVLFAFPRTSPAQTVEAAPPRLLFQQRSFRGRDEPIRRSRRSAAAADRVPSRQPVGQHFVDLDARAGVWGALNASSVNANVVWQIEFTADVVIVF